MARFRVSLRGVAAAAGAAYASIKAGSVKAMFVKKVIIALSDATATPFGLYYESDTVTQSSEKTPLCTSNVASAITARAAAAWSAAPALGSAEFLHRETLAAAIGQRAEITFDGTGIKVPAGKTLVLWNFHGSSAGGTPDVTFEGEE